MNPDLGLLEEALGHEPPFLPEFVGFADSGELELLDLPPLSW